MYSWHFHTCCNNHNFWVYDRNLMIIILYLVPPPHCSSSTLKCISFPMIQIGSPNCEWLFLDVCVFATLHLWYQVSAGRCDFVINVADLASAKSGKGGNGYYDSHQQLHPIFPIRASVEIFPRFLSELSCCHLLKCLETLGI